MAKRSDFARIGKDRYLTPEAAVKPLIPFLPPEPFTFAEPCAGDGRLIRHIEGLSEGACHWHSDIEPLDGSIPVLDALSLEEKHVDGCTMIITNPPWSRDKKSGQLMHRLIERFVPLRPTWLLFDSDWMHTKQATPYIKDWLVCSVSVGRVKWFEESKMSGKDNCSWYYFVDNARADWEAPMLFGRDIMPEV